jgi:hypothetical protein
MWLRNYFFGPSLKGRRKPGSNVVTWLVLALLFALLAWNAVAVVRWLLGRI